jgi:hypothetical protein
MPREIVFSFGRMLKETQYPLGNLQQIADGIAMAIACPDRLFTLLAR